MAGPAQCAESVGKSILVSLAWIARCSSHTGPLAGGGLNAQRRDRARVVGPVHAGNTRQSGGSDRAVTIFFWRTRHNDASACNFRNTFGELGDVKAL
jgi:hypothetical protein